MKVSKGANKSNTAVGVYSAKKKGVDDSFQRQIEDLSKMHEVVSDAEL